MTIWMTVQLLQCTGLACAVLAGMLLLRLPLRHSLTAALFTLPAPLFQATPGTAGFVYAGDLVGLAMFPVLLSAGLRNRWCQRRYWPVILTVGFLLLGWPAVVTLLNSLGRSSLDPKLVALGFLRSLTYCSIFLLGLLLVGDEKWQTGLGMIGVGCLSFGLTSMLGVAQFRLGIDLDLWNYVRELRPGEYTDGFGGGYMGLYRGAVGAWAASMLGLVPLVFASRSWGWWVSPFVSCALLWGVLVTGSRQGAIFGVFGAGVGLAVAVFAAPRTKRLLEVAKMAKSLVLLALAGLLISSLIPNSSFRDWLSYRFSESIGDQSLIQAGLLRETKTEAILEQLANRPLVMTAGVGYGGILEEVPLTGDDYEVVYVDSELLWLLQQGGVVQVIVYLGFLFWMAAAAFKGMNHPDHQARLAIGCALVSVVVGTAFIYGHYFLLHVQSTQSPIACWNWLVLGIGYSAIRSRSSPRNEVPSPSSTRTLQPQMAQ